MDWSRCFCGTRWPGNGLNMRAGTGTVPLTHTPSTLLRAWHMVGTPCLLGEGRARRGLRSDWTQPPTKETSLLEKRFTEGETESRGVVWREKAQLGLERLGLK